MHETATNVMTDHELASHIFAYVVNQTLDEDTFPRRDERNKAFIDGLGLLADTEQMQAAKQIICTEYEFDLDDPDCFPEDQGREAKELVASILQYF